jgi:hypothetical protein
MRDRETIDSKLRLLGPDTAGAPQRVRLHLTAALGDATLMATSVAALFERHSSDEDFNEDDAVDIIADSKHLVDAIGQALDALDRLGFDRGQQ